MGEIILEKISFREWLGLKTELDFSKARPLGIIVGAMLMLGAVALVLICIVGLMLLFGTFLGFGPHSGDLTGAAIRNIGLVLVAIVGFPFVVWRSVVAQKNSVTAAEAQITDRINKAILGLGADKSVKRIVETVRYVKEGDGWKKDKDGSLVPALRPDGTPLIDRKQFEETLPNIEVRIGAVLSLERISRDSVRDFLSIMEILAAYLRENARIGKVESLVDDSMNRKIREDIQAATVVVARSSGRRTPFPRNQSSPARNMKFSADLSYTRLDGLAAYGSNFEGATLDGSSWIGADLGFSNFAKIQARNSCDFSGADLEGSNFDDSEIEATAFSKETVLAEASFRRARLHQVVFRCDDAVSLDFEGAMVIRCTFSGILLHGVNFKNAYLNDSSFSRAGFYNSDFSGAKNWDQSQFESGFGICAGVGETRIPSGAEYPDHWLDLSNLGPEFDPFETFVYEYERWAPSLEKFFK